MRRRLRRALALLALLLIAAALWLGLQSQRRPSLEPYQHLTLPTNTGAAPAGRLRVRFAGVSTLVFDDGETAWISDGFFSRPALGALLGRIAPDAARVRDELRQLGVRRLAAVVPLHAHYDHAMDAPLVAQQTGALLIGSASTLNIGRGAGLAETAMREVGPGDVLQLGKFTLTFLAGRHSPTPWSDGSGHEDIEAPLTPPALASAWREGQVWSLLVEHEGRRLLLQASAGFVPGALRGRAAEVVFLGVGTLGKKSDDYAQRYWAEVVQAVDARRVVPIHWDDFWLPLSEPLRPMPYLFDDFAHTMSDLQRRALAEGRELRLPPTRAPFDPFAGLTLPP